MRYVFFLFLFITFSYSYSSRGEICNLYGASSPELHNQRNCTSVQYCNSRGYQEGKCTDIFEGEQSFEILQLYPYKEDPATEDDMRSWFALVLQTQDVFVGNSNAYREERQSCEEEYISCKCADGQLFSPFLNYCVPRAQSFCSPTVEENSTTLYFSLQGSASADSCVNESQGRLAKFLQVEQGGKTYSCCYVAAPDSNNSNPAPDSNNNEGEDEEEGNKEGNNSSPSSASASYCPPFYDSLPLYRESFSPFSGIEECSEDAVFEFDVFVQGQKKHVYCCYIAFSGKFDTNTTKKYQNDIAKSISQTISEYTKKDVPVHIGLPTSDCSCEDPVFSVELFGMSYSSQISLCENLAKGLPFVKVALYFVISIFILIFVAKVD